MFSSNSWKICLQASIQLGMNMLMFQIALRRLSTGKHSPLSTRTIYWKKLEPFMGCFVVEDAEVILNL